MAQNASSRDILVPGSRQKGGPFLTQGFFQIVQFFTGSDRRARRGDNFQVKMTAFTLTKSYRFWSRGWCCGAQRRRPASRHISSGELITSSRLLLPSHSPVTASLAMGGAAVKFSTPEPSSAAVVPALLFKIASEAPLVKLTSAIPSSSMSARSVPSPPPQDPLRLF